jgi:multiple sugar transport system substrate-binding protein
MDQVYTDWDETVGKALADKGDTAAATDTWQDRTTTYAESQGFTVE